MKRAISTLIALLLIAGAAYAQSQCGPNGCPPTYSVPHWGKATLPGGVQYQGNFLQRDTITVPSRTVEGCGVSVWIEFDLGGDARTTGSQSSIGSGFLLRNGADGRVVTAAHLVRGAVGPPTVYFQDGTSAVGKVIATSSEADLAMIRVRSPMRVIATIASSPPAVGETVSWTGYKFSYAGGRRAARLACSSGPFTMRRGRSLFFRPRVLPVGGASGGAISNSDGEIVGVLSEVGESDAVGCDLESLTEFIANHLDPAPPATVPVTPPAAPPATPPAAPPDLTTEIAELRALILELANRKPLPGPRGERGEPGADGAPGPAGPAGADASPVDIDAITAKVLANLPPMVIDITQANGTVIRKSVPLGEPMPLKFSPIHAD